MILRSVVLIVNKVGVLMIVVPLYLLPRKANSPSIPIVYTERNSDRNSSIKGKRKKRILFQRQISSAAIAAYIETCSRENTLRTLAKGGVVAWNCAYPKYLYFSFVVSIVGSRRFRRVSDATITKFSWMNVPTQPGSPPKSLKYHWMNASTLRTIL